MPTKARIPLPSNLDPGTTKCFQFNVPDDPEWLGMFWGALYNLSVWTAFGRSGDTSAADVASIWRQVIEEARNSECSAPCSPVFIGTNSGYNDHTNTTGHSYLVPGCSGCGGDASQVFGHRQLDQDTQLADQALVFEDNDFGLPSGVHVCEFRAIQVDSTVGNAWNFVYDSCIETDITEIQSGIVFYKTDFIMKKWGLSSLAPYAFFIAWDGPIICTEA